MKRRTNDGATALMLAADRGHGMCVDILLGAGANVNAENGSGRTALIYAADTGYLKCIQLLLAAGASVNSNDSNGETALNVAMRPRETGNNIGRRKYVQMVLTVDTKILFSPHTFCETKRKWTKLLFVAGGTTGRNIPHGTPDFFEETKESCLSLKSQCRRVVKKHLTSAIKCTVEFSY